MFSCKVHAFKELKENHMEPFRAKLNQALRDLLPEENKEEIKVFCVLEVSNRFNAKINTSYREYSYYLPTFMLNPIDHCYLGKKGTNLQVEEHMLPKDEDVTKVKVVNGITITKRYANEADELDLADHHLLRDISHLTSNPKFVENLYATRLTEAQREELHQLFKTTFAGTKKYHNYTRDMRPHQNASQRFMIELRANDYMYVNQDTFEVTDASDPRALEFVHFYLKGQSFLYNQIRKMVGSMIQSFHGNMDKQHFLANTFTENGVNVALAPGDGLMLERVAYDRYNEFNTAKKQDVMIQLVQQTEEIEQYRRKLVSHIAQRELKDRAFLSWVSWFDDNCEQYFIKPPSEEQILKIRG